MILEMLLNSFLKNLVSHFFIMIRDFPVHGGLFKKSFQGFIQYSFSGIKPIYYVNLFKSRIVMILTVKKCHFDIRQIEYDRQFIQDYSKNIFPPPFRLLLSLIEKISKEFEKIGRTILIYYITPYINTLGIPSVDCRILLRKQKYESRVFSTSFD